MIPTPRAELIDGIRAILVEHNRLEEEPGGLYELADAAVGTNVLGRRPAHPGPERTR